MPAQTPVAVGTAYYSQHDTAPDLRRQLLNGDGSPIDLTAATSVVIIIGYLRYQHYYSPFPRLIDRDGADIDVDPTTGFVSWTPGVVRGTDALHIPGLFDQIWEINWNDGTVQTVPAHTYEKVVVTTKPGGFEQL